MSDKRTVLSCEPVTIVIIVILLLFGGGVGGYVIRGEVAPKTVNQNQYILTVASANALASANNITVVLDGKIIKSISLAYDGITNLEVLLITNGITNWLENETQLPDDVQKEIKKAKALLPKIK